MEHHYLSTGCLHGLADNIQSLHDYCQSPQREDGGTKAPAACKFCSAPCECPCHRSTSED